MAGIARGAFSESWAVGAIAWAIVQQTKEGTNGFCLLILKLINLRLINKSIRIDCSNTFFSIFVNN